MRYAYSMLEGSPTYDTSADTRAEASVKEANFHIETEDREEAKQKVFERIVEDLLQKAAGREENREYHNRSHSENEVLAGVEKIADIFLKHGLLKEGQIPYLRIAAAGHDVIQAGYSDLVPEYVAQKNPVGGAVIAQGLPGRRRRKIGIQNSKLDTSAQEEFETKLQAEPDEIKKHKLGADRERSVLEVSFQNEEESIQAVRDLLKKYTFGNERKRVLIESDIENFFEHTIQKPILATKPAFTFGTIVPSELEKSLPQMSPEDAKRYANGLKIYQDKINTSSSPEEVALALADLRAVYFKDNGPEVFLESGNREWQETRRGELVQLLSHMGNPNQTKPGDFDIEKIKAYYAWDITDWVRGQVTFALWQKILTEELIKNLEFIKNAPQSEFIQADLQGLFDFQTGINEAVKRDQVLQGKPLSKKALTDTYSNQEILELLAYVGVKDKVLEKLCAEAGVTVRQILEADSQK